MGEWGWGKRRGKRERRGSKRKAQKIIAEKNVESRASTYVLR